MAKIALELEKALERRGRAGEPGGIRSRVLAHGEGWTVEDVICTSGPQDRRFEEQHSTITIALVASGTFEYRSGNGSELMTPGSFLLGNLGQTFECGHEHAQGDRCISFRYTLEYFEGLLEAVGTRRSKTVFVPLRLPPMRELSPLVARSLAGLAGRGCFSWEELSLQALASIARLADGERSPRVEPTAAAVARVSRSVREIECGLAGELSLRALAAAAGLSTYHFLRTFERLTGLTPHQYLRRMRLRAAAIRLQEERAKIIDVAYDTGFGDISNFNHAFRNEFGLSPRAFRRQRELKRNPVLLFHPSVG